MIPPHLLETIGDTYILGRCTAVHCDSSIPKRTQTPKLNHTATVEGNIPPSWWSFPTGLHRTSGSGGRDENPTSAVAVGVVRECADTGESDGAAIGGIDPYIRGIGLTACQCSQRAEIQEVPAPSADSSRSAL
ncbi:MAG: hypothetical protein RNU03_00090 [Candidatus Sedimenticola sp. (ex Thyasira tokunagai)]